MKSRSKLIAVISILSLLVLAGFVIASRHLFPTTANEQEDQWMMSGHNFDPGHTSATTRASCVECHDSASFVKIRVMGEELPIDDGGTPEDTSDDGPADLEEQAAFGHVCTTCHDVNNPTNILALHLTGDVTLPAYGDVVSAGVSAACMECHNGRRTNPEEYVLGSRRGSHHGPQADILTGTGAIDFGETLGSSLHTSVVTHGCVECHMAAGPPDGDRGDDMVGEHTFKMRWDGGTPDNPTDDIENLTSCRKCHAGIDTFNIPAKGDYDGDGEMEGVQDEVAGLLEAVAAELPQNEDGEVSLPSDLELTTVEQRMANFNYVMVLEDRSLGIHNTAYAVQALRVAYKGLTGSDFSGDKPLGIPLTANRPVTSDAIEKRLKQWELAAHSYDATDEHVLEELHESPVRASCLRCKDADGFVNIAVKGEDPPEEDLAEGSPYGISCKTCHAIDDATNILRLNKVGDITLPAYGDVVDAGVSAACMYCHNARRANPPEYVLGSSRGTHGGPQADMLAGKSAIDYGETLNSTSHFSAIEKKCVGCHMAKTPDGPGKDMVGEHTFSMVSEGGIENVGACTSCHNGIATFNFPAKEDVDGDGVIEGVQTEIDGMLAILASVLPKNEEGNISISEGTPAERMANYNYTLVNSDGSRGIHNFRYAVSVLRAAYKNLTGEEIGGPADGGKDYSNVFFAELSPGLNMISLPLEPITPATARSFSEQVLATAVIRYDEAANDFDGFSPSAPGDGFDIEGGKGYIVNVPNGATIVHSGAAWTNEPSGLAAPPAVGNSDAWAFLVNGYVLDGGTMSASSGGYTVTVRNLSTGATAARTVGDSGYFSAAWADLSRKAVIKAGDRIEVAAFDSSGEIVSGPFVHEVTLDRIRDAVVDVRMTLGDVMPTQSVLLQNYPNPFNPETWIPYHLKEADSVSIAIYDTAGGLVRTLYLGHRDAGIYVSRSKAAYWDGRNETGERVASGIYFYSINSGSFSAIKKMVIAQ
ncbi:FlgD immunoglobulin-like domain containing protein [Candidatus Poribacteria bacterium]